MEYLHKDEILQILRKIEETIEKIERRNRSIHTVDDYLLSEAGMEKLDAACMLIQTIGENVKVVDYKTKGELLSRYPQIPWKRVMGMRDYISHHYDGVDADVVFEVIRHNLPPLLDAIKIIIHDIE